MKKIDAAKMLGITTRQHLDNVLADRANFSIDVAEKAVEFFGGDLATWMKKSEPGKRKEIYKNFIFSLKNEPR